MIHEHQAVSDFSSGCDGVRINDQGFDAAIIATGAEGHALVGVEPLLNRIRPVKGQMLALRVMPPGWAFVCGPGMPMSLKSAMAGL
ncbi:FAD-dependent oxidoreductase [Hyphobacterium sp. CCMP332]|uniref:FAD-dependent oxidoreductase n=1 Tax=Hyphobacterium sp. CCMP332 TaxID=2749086 RepID=UPI00351C333D